MSLIANAKAKALKGNVSEAFKNEAGAIDLASIMVGIIVIGLIGGVIAATVFAVIPWAQDNAAKQQLDSVASAQAAYIGLSADKAGGSQTKFGSATDLSTEKLFDASAAKVSIATSGTGTAAHYGAANKSASGKFFYISDTKTQPTGVSGATAAADTKTAVETAVKGGDAAAVVTWSNNGAAPATGPIA